jgi:hypothetical protein
VRWLPRWSACSHGVSAKHEGGDPEIDATREHPSDILDYFWDKTEIEAAGDML